MRKVTIILLFLLAVCSQMAIAQELTVKSITMAMEDSTALIEPCLDNNGDTCALIKINVGGLEGLEFTNKNQYAKACQRDGSYLVYVPIAIGRRLDYHHADYLPGQIDLGVYGYRRLRSGKTYLVEMELPVQHSSQGLVAVKVVPREAALFVNDELVESSGTGLYELSLPLGEYRYRVTHDDYTTLDGTLIVDNAEAKSLTLRPQPILHIVNVSSNVSGAHVFIDGIDYGGTGSISMPQGWHKIRIRKDGYIDEEREVEVGSMTLSQDFRLKKNQNVKEVHAVPVKIYSSSSKVYKNNKEIHEWASGKEILFMPGKYELSDKEGNRQIIDVKNDPLSVMLGTTEQTEQNTVPTVSENERRESVRQTTRTGDTYNAQYQRNLQRMRQQRLLQQYGNRNQNRIQRNYQNNTPVRGRYGR